MVRSSTVNSIKSLIGRYRVAPYGTSNEPGYICIIRKGNLVRFGFSRRPKDKLINKSNSKDAQELVWYGFTENMLAAKRRAQTYFVKYQEEGDWLKISPLIAMTYFKRYCDKP